jgi:hypothetical protein
VALTGRPLAGQLGDELGDGRDLVRGGEVGDRQPDRPPRQRVPTDDPPALPEQRHELRPRPPGQLEGDDPGRASRVGWRQNPAASDRAEAPLEVAGGRGHDRLDPVEPDLAQLREGLGEGGVHLEVAAAELEPTGVVAQPIGAGQHVEAGRRRRAGPGRLQLGDPLAPNVERAAAVAAADPLVAGHRVVVAADRAQVDRELPERLGGVE